MAFRASASDPDGDPVSYAWDFGDGATAWGENVTHVFTGKGTFSVALTVKDGRGGTTTSRTSVTARTLNGTWQRRDCCADGSRDDRSDFQCVQTGAGLDCRRIRSTGIFTIVRWEGFLAHPRLIDVQIEEMVPNPFQRGRCRGEVLPSLDCFRCIEALGQTQPLYRSSAGDCR